MKSELFFLGDALLDISVECDVSLINKYNLHPDEKCEMTDQQNGLLEEIMEKKSVRITPGGSAQNSSRVAKWIFRDEDSFTVTFVGSVGKDNYANILEQQMKSSGVNVIYQQHSCSSTGITAGLITSKNETALCAKLAAAALFDFNFLNKPRLKESMLNADILHVEGYLLSHSTEAVLQVAKFAQKHNKTFSLALSAVYICELRTQALVDCISYAQIVFANESEAKALLGALGKENTDIEQCMKHIASISKTEKSPFIAVITSGPNPVVLLEGKNPIKSFDVPEIKEICDTTGCGDALLGGFLASYCLNKNVDSAIKYGISAAREVAQHYGCTFPPKFTSTMLIK